MNLICAYSVESLLSLLLPFVGRDCRCCACGLIEGLIEGFGGFDASEVFVKSRLA